MRPDRAAFDVTSEEKDAPARELRVLPAAPTPSYEDIMSTLARHAIFLCLSVLLLALAACGGNDASDARRQAALVASPGVGDYYAAELTYFSGADFESRERVFGLMKIVAVDGDDITLVTENGGSPDRDVALKDIGADPSAIEFDQSERIIITRADLEAAHAAGKIFAVKR
jgi:hypothetical protein